MSTNQTPAISPASHATCTSRRAFVRSVAVGFGAVALPAASLRALAQSTKLDPSADLATSLNYTLESAVDGQNCDNCLFYGEQGAEWASCQIFAEQLVKGSGHCTSWTPAG